MHLVQKQAGRRPPRLGEVAFKGVKKSHAKLYSGVAKSRLDQKMRSKAEKKNRSASLPLTELDAVEQLQQAGWLSKPGNCPHCGMRRWSALHTQQFTTCQAYYRCLDPDCQMRTNAMKFLGKLPADSVARTLTPRQLILCITVSWYKASLSFS